jgi:hypothetical protein
LRFTNPVLSCPVLLLLLLLLEKPQVAAATAAAAVHQSSAELPCEGFSRCFDTLTQPCGQCLHLLPQHWRCPRYFAVNTV